MKSRRHTVFRVMYWIVAVGIVAVFGWITYWLYVEDTWFAIDEEGTAYAINTLVAAIRFGFFLSGATVGVLFLGLNVRGFFLFRNRRILYSIVGALMFIWSLLSVYALLR